MAPDLLIQIAWKSLVLGAGWLVMLRCLRRLSAHKRALVGHGGIIAALLLVPLTIWGPAWALDVRMPEVIPVHSAGPERPEGVSQPFTGEAAPGSRHDQRAVAAEPAPLALAAALHGCVVLFFLLSTAVSVARACALGRRSIPVTDPAWTGPLAELRRTAGIATRVDLRVSAEVGAPISLGLWRPMIVLDPETFRTPSCARAVLGHELAHVGSQDWGKLLVCRLSVAVLWFNPAIWMLARACAQLREEAADDVVLRGQVGVDDYASLLIEVASRRRRAGAALASHLATGTSLKRRLVRILARGMDRAPAGMMFKGACLAVVALAVPLAALTPTAAALPVPGRHVSSAAGAPVLGETVGTVRTSAGPAVSPGPSLTGGGATASALQTSARPSPGAADQDAAGRVLPALNAIQLYGWAEIRVRRGSEPRLRVVSGSAEQTVFDVDEASGRLSVMSCTHACPPANLVLEVTTPTLPSLGVTGGGAIKALRGFPAQGDIRALVMGGGVVDVSSVKSGSGRVDITSGGSVIADPDAELATNIVDGGSVIRRAAAD